MEPNFNKIFELIDWAIENKPTNFPDGSGRMTNPEVHSALYTAGGGFYIPYGGGWELEKVRASYFKEEWESPLYVEWRRRAAATRDSSVSEWEHWEPLRRAQIAFIEDIVEKLQQTYGGHAEKRSNETWYFPDGKSGDVAISFCRHNSELRIHQMIRGSGWAVRESRGNRFNESATLSSVAELLHLAPIALEPNAYHPLPG